MGGLGRRRDANAAKLAVVSGRPVSVGPFPTAGPTASDGRAGLAVPPRLFPRPTHGGVRASVIFRRPPPTPMATRSTRRSAPAPVTTRGVTTMPFSRQNYRLLLGAVGLIVLGYAVMLVDNATSANPVDSPLSLVVAPLLLLVGYVGVAGAVLWGVPRDAGPEPDAAPE